jgi:histidinol-phosphate aminotransferase
VAEINLASNENPFGPSPKAVAAVQTVAAGCHLYPDNDATELRRKLAEHHSVSEEQILIGAGLTDLIATLARTLLKPGLNAVTSERSFIVYGMAARDAGGSLIETKVQHDGFDLDAIATVVDSDTRLIFLANPNNPTGTLFDATATLEFLSKVPQAVTVVLDEAYYEYAKYFAAKRKVNYSQSLDYVRQGRNVIVLRTFSKAHGLAGLRVGYALGQRDLLNHCALRRNLYSVSIPAQSAAIAALEDEVHIQRSVQSNATEAKWLADELLKLGKKVVPTWANFLYCNIGSDADELAHALEKEGVAIRSLNRWGTPQAIRITIGTREQNQQFIAAFKKTSH